MTSSQIAFWIADRISTGIAPPDVRQRRPATIVALSPSARAPHVEPEARDADQRGQADAGEPIPAGPGQVEAEQPRDASG